MLMEKKSYLEGDWILKSTENLRKAILAHPDWPIVFSAGESANNGDYSYMFCTRVNVEEGEILDCEQDVNDEIVYTDRDRFEEDLRDIFDGRWNEDDEETTEKMVQEELAKYDPYWKDCILVTVDN